MLMSPAVLGTSALLASALACFLTLLFARSCSAFMAHKSFLSRVSHCRLLSPSPDIPTVAEKPVMSSVNNHLSPSDHKRPWYSFLDVLCFKVCFTPSWRWMMVVKVMAVMLMMMMMMLI